MKRRRLQWEVRALQDFIKYWETHPADHVKKWVEQASQRLILVETLLDVYKQQKMLTKSKPYVKTLPQARSWVGEERRLREGRDQLKLALNV
jgi:hypothetical protein